MNERDIKGNMQNQSWKRFWKVHLSLVIGFSTSSVNNGFSAELHAWNARTALSTKGHAQLILLVYETNHRR